MAKEQNLHYVNNKVFSQAVVEYCKKVNEARQTDDKIPIVPNYIAECFLKIAEGLSHRANFSKYTYREEMVMDAVENCLRAIENYNIDATTRTGTPNAFSYFTQISWYAFLRRIQKEKKQQDIKNRYITTSGIADLIDHEDDIEAKKVIEAFVDQLKDRIDKVKEVDYNVKEFAARERAKDRATRKRAVPIDSDLGDFIE